MLLTKISPTRPRHHFRLKFDDGSSLVLSADAILEHHLKIGFDVPDPLLKTLTKLSSSGSHFNAAAHFLAFRPRSTSEVTTYLKRREASQKEIDNTLKCLTNLNLLDDAAFASWLIPSRLKRGRSLAHIRFELRHFGLSDLVINQAISSLPKSDTQSGLDSLIVKKLFSLRALPPREARQKLTNYLFRKGFSSSDIASAIDRCLKKS